MPAVNYDYPEDRFRRWKIAHAYQGGSFKDWVGKALDEIAEQQITEHEQAERRRRGR